MARIDNIYLHELCGAHMLMHLRDDHVDDISLHTHTYMYIHRYAVFLVVLISVRLALAHPNNDPYLLLAYSHFYKQCTCYYLTMRSFIKTPVLHAS